MAGFATSNLSNGPQMPHATRDKQLLKVMKDFLKIKKKHKGSQVIWFHLFECVGAFPVGHQRIYGLFLPRLLCIIIVIIFHF